jgi:hypothetical protein
MRPLIEARIIAPRIVTGNSGRSEFKNDDFSDLQTRKTPAPIHLTRPDHLRESFIAS